MPARDPLGEAGAPDAEATSVEPDQIATTLSVNSKPLHCPALTLRALRATDRASWYPMKGRVPPPPIYSPRMIVAGATLAAAHPGKAATQLQTTSVAGIRPRINNAGAVGCNAEPCCFTTRSFKPTARPLSPGEFGDQRNEGKGGGLPRHHAGYLPGHEPDRL